MWLCASAAHTGCVSACVWVSCRERVKGRQTKMFYGWKNLFINLWPNPFKSVFAVWVKTHYRFSQWWRNKKNITTMMQCTRKDCSYCHFICPPLSVCSRFYFLSFWAQLSLSYSWTNSNCTSATSGKNKRVLLLWMQISKVFSKNGWSAQQLMVLQITLSASDRRNRSILVV